MDVDARVRPFVLAAFVDRAPLGDLVRIAAALGLPAPEAEALPRARNDMFEILDIVGAEAKLRKRYTRPFAAAVEQRRITLVHLLRAAAVAQEQPWTSWWLRWVHQEFMSDLVERRNNLRDNGDRDLGRLVADVVSAVRAFPKSAAQMLAQTTVLAPQAYEEHRLLPPTGRIVDRDSVRGVIPYLSAPIGATSRFSGDRVTTLVDALAELHLDCQQLTRLLDVVPLPDAAAAASTANVRSLLELAVRQGVTAYQLYDSCKAAGRLDAADLVVWHLTNHPSAYRPPPSVQAAAGPSGPPPSASLQPSSKRPRRAEYTAEADSVTARLPMELLVAVLRQLHALTDVIKARLVCQRWRDAVAIVAAHDRAFVYRCGLPDWVAVRNLDGFPDPADTFSYIDEWPNSVDMWCTCGRRLPTIVSATMLDCARPPNWTAYEPSLALSYRDRHATAVMPPARWEQLRPSRNLALELAQVCARVDSRVPTATIGFTQAPWLPLFLWLPESVIRPRTSDELLALVRALVHNADVSANLDGFWALLSTGPSAREWYESHVALIRAERTVALRPTWDTAWSLLGPPASAVPSFDPQSRHTGPHWRHAFHQHHQVYETRTHGHLLIDDPGNWHKRRFCARRAVVELQFALQSDALADYSSWHNMYTPLMNLATGHATAAYLADQVAAVDVAATVFAERCVLSCTHATIEDIADEIDYPAATFFIGLDAFGHLVGAVTATQIPM